MNRITFLLLFSGYILLGLACDGEKNLIRKRPNPIIQIATGLTESYQPSIRSPVWLLQVTQGIKEPQSLQVVQVSSPSKSIKAFWFLSPSCKAVPTTWQHTESWGFGWKDRREQELHHCSLLVPAVCVVVGQPSHPSPMLWASSSSHSSSSCFTWLWQAAQPHSPRNKWIPLSAQENDQNFGSKSAT